MIRGYYTAASGIVTQEKKLNAYANNIANSTKPGYKKDNLVLGTFGEHITVSMNAYDRKDPDALSGTGIFMQVVDDKYTDHSQGAFDTTARPLDLAVQGAGYFVIEDAEGNELLTRDGQFALDEDGYLVLPGIGRVQGVNGDLRIGTSDFAVDSDGYVYLLPQEEDDEPTEIGRILLVIPTDYADMEKTPSGLFVTENHIRIADGETALGQGMLERSNVDMSEEMSRIISTQRGLQSASQLVRMYDEMSQKSTEQLGRVR